MMEHDCGVLETAKRGINSPDLAPYHSSSHPRRASASAHAAQWPRRRPTHARLPRLLRQRLRLLLLAVANGMQLLCGDERHPRAHGGLLGDHPATFATIFDAARVQHPSAILAHHDAMALSHTAWHLLWRSVVWKATPK